MTPTEQKIEALEKELARLKELRDEEAGWTVYQRLAVRLHDETCHHNHTDGCSWYYEISQGRHDWNASEHIKQLSKVARIEAFARSSGITTEKAVDLIIAAAKL